MYYIYLRIGEVQAGHADADLRERSRGVRAAMDREVQPSFGYTGLAMVEMECIYVDRTSGIAGAISKISSPI